jgi:acetoin:2,6-dichlorophenolindophenol oxidoreductase subunit beta
MSDDSAAIKMFFREAIVSALREAMCEDPDMILLGQDIGAFGGPYRDFAGLYAEFGPERVRDTPVAEASMIALAAGCAAAGVRTLVNITYMDFLMIGLDPLVNYAAKVRFKTAGQLHAPLVVKTTAGAKGQGVAHSQTLEAWLMGVPGLRVVAPSSPADAYGLLKSALREEGPVVFMDHKRLFPLAGPVPLGRSIPFGKARLLREGTDITITCHSYMTVPVLSAAEELASAGISADVLDLRCLAPLDSAAIIASAARTGRLLTVEEGQTICGVGAEVAFRAQEAVPGLRIARIGAATAPVSFNPVLEAAALPNAAGIVSAARALMS